MLNRLNIGPKLLLAPAAVVLLLIFSSCAAYYAMVRQNQVFETIVHARAERIQQANRLLGEAEQAHADIYQLLTWLGNSFSEARVSALRSEIGQRHRSIVQRFDALGAATAGQAAGQRLQGLARSAFTLYLRDVHDVLELAAVDRSMGANAMSKADLSFDVVERHLSALAALEQSLSERAANEARADFRAAAVLMPALIALSVLLALGITMAVRAAMLKDVRAIGAAAIGLAEGDLRVPRRHYGRDEIAETSRALDASIRNLNRTLRTIRDGARALDPGELASGAPAPGAERARHDRQRVRDTAATAGALQRQAQDLQRSVAGFKLDEGAPAPDLRCVGALEEPPAAKGGGRLRLATRKPKGGGGAYS